MKLEFFKIYVKHNALAVARAMHKGESLTKNRKKGFKTKPRGTPCFFFLVALELFLRRYKYSLEIS